MRVRACAAAAESRRRASMGQGSVFSIVKGHTSCFHLPATHRRVSRLSPGLADVSSLLFRSRVDEGRACRSLLQRHWQGRVLLRSRFWGNIRSGLKGQPCRNCWGAFPLTTRKTDNWTLTLMVNLPPTLRPEWRKLCAVLTGGDVINTPAGRLCWLFKGLLRADTPLKT